MDMRLVSTAQHGRSRIGSLCVLTRNLPRDRVRQGTVGALGQLRARKAKAWSNGGLDGHHDVNDPQRANKYGIRVAHDPRGACDELAQLTVNVLADMGVLPATLAAPYAVPPPSTDGTPPDGGVRELALTAERAVRAAGWATDAGGGVVAAVEVSWDGARFHPAELRALAERAEWSFAWGQEAWQRAHGEPPAASLSKLWLRLADDSGNLAVVETRVAPTSAG